MASATVVRRTLKTLNSAVLRTLTTCNRQFSGVATAGEPHEVHGVSSSSFTFSSDGDKQNSNEKNDSIYVKGPNSTSKSSFSSESVSMPMSFMTGSIVGKRFYRKVSTREADDGNGWTVILDYRTLKTPAKRPLKCPTPALAAAIAAEWEYQHADGIRPFTMPLMKLACTALERVPLTRPKIIENLIKKFNMDLVFCRAPEDNDLTRSLLERQVEKIDPLLHWLESEFGYKPVVYSSFFGGKQEQGLVAAVESLLENTNDCELAAIDAIAAAAHSLVIAIGMFRGKLEIEEAVELIRLEEDIQAPSAKVSQHAPATPCRESTRPKSPNYGRKSTGPKWHILSSVYPKSLTACRSKLQSPTLSTPFILRTEERAARRKQKLEEKFNSKEVQKVQLQTKLKEKAESELRLEEDIQVDRWGLVEGGHDVDIADLRVQVSSAAVFLGLSRRN